jgi:hypothetical protein
MRLLERQYKVLDLANWIAPLGWIFVARRLHFSSWLVLAGLLLAFLCVNYRISFSEGVPAPEATPRRPRPIYCFPGSWLGLALAACLGDLLVQSQWLLGTLLVSGTLGAVVATFSSLETQARGVTLAFVFF